MVATAPGKQGRTRPTAAQKRVIDQWLQIPKEYGEVNLNNDLFLPLLKELGIRFDQRTSGVNVGQSRGLIPDCLIYQDKDQPPVLTVELKKRVPELAKATDAEFINLTQQHCFYRDAVGYNVSRNQNGICQYLNVDLVKPEYLAPYGLVFNGDFFQLWRRVDGLIFPLTPIQRITKASIPELMQQLEYCLTNPQPALVATIWNRKGGVAKTTNTLNLGATLGLKGKRILLVDLDPQEDLTRGLGLQSPADYIKPCVDQLELHNFEDAKAILQNSIQVRTLPTSDNQSFEISLLSTDRGSLENLRDRKTHPSPPVFLKRVIQLLQPDYDYIFIDVSPSPDLLTQAVLYSCDTVLIPSDLGGKAVHHAVQLYEDLIPRMRTLRSEKERLHLAPWNLGIVFSNCPADSDGLEKMVNAELQQKNFTGKRYETLLRTYAQTKVAEFKGLPVVCWQNSPITKLYSRLTDEVFLSHNFIDH